MGGSLRRSLLILLASAVLPLVAVLSWAGLEDYAFHKSAAETDIVRVAAIVARDVDGLATNVQSILSVVGQLVDTSPARRADNDRILKAARANLPPYFNTLNLFGPDGDLWGTSIEPPPVSRRPTVDRFYFRDALRVAGLSAGDPVRARTTGTWSISFALPVHDMAGQLTAVVAASLSLDRLQDELLRDYDLPGESTVTLVAGDGTIIARTLDPGTWVGRNIGSRENYRLARSQGSGREVFTGADGIERISAFVVAGKVPWLVYVGMPTDAVHGDQRQRLLGFVLTVLLALGLSGLLSWRLARSIRRSVVKVQEGARVLATGALDHRLAVGGDRELEALATSINSMAESLEQRERALEQGRRENAAARARLQAIFEAEPAMVLIAREDGEIDMINAAGLELCGARSVDDMAGQPLLALVDPADRGVFEAHFERALMGARETVEFAILNRAGQRRSMSGVGGPVRLNGHVVPQTGYIGVMRDVTEEREAEVIRRQAQRLAAVGELTGGIAHDFNNLLTVIIGALEMLEPVAQADPVARRSMNLALRSTERATELTRRLLAFARRQPLEPRVIDANALIRSSVGLLRGTLGEHLEIETVLGAGLWMTLADPGQLENALLNLAVNGRDAMPGGGKLTVETSNAWLGGDYSRAHEEVRPGQYVLIAVSDTGIGMTPELVERAFEPFFTTKGVGAGTGLGLSMVHGFVKQSGGHVKIYSEPGTGTTVKMYLPRSHAGGVSAPAPATGDVPRGQGETVLAVEDDPEVRELVTATLEGLGYAAIVVTDGPAALEVLRGDTRVDVLFTDVVLPGGMNGRQIADSAAALRPGLPVLFTSGYTENAIIHHGRVDPDVLLVTKPWRRDELARRLREAIDGRD